jgi:hypothetical protein
MNINMIDIRRSSIKICKKTNSLSEKGPNPPDFDERGCSQKRKACLVASVMAPKPENSKFTSKLKICKNHNTYIFCISTYARMLFAILWLLRAEPGG